MLKDLLDKKQCFKLVCGAGNEDAIEVERLVTIYSKAGCMFFDVCAKPEIVDAAKRGLKNAGIEKTILVATGQIEAKDLLETSPYVVKNLAEIEID